MTTRVLTNVRSVRLVGLCLFALSCAVACAEAEPEPAPSGEEPAVRVDTASEIVVGKADDGMGPVDDVEPAMPAPDLPTYHALDGAVGEDATSCGEVCADAGFECAREYFPGYPNVAGKAYWGGLSTYLFCGEVPQTRRYDPMRDVESELSRVQCYCADGQ